MTTAAAIAQINHQTLAYLPAVLAGIQAAEAAAPAAPGPTKFAAVLDGISATSQALEGSPNPDIAGISALINLTVFLFNSLGRFHHATTNAASPAA